MTNSALRRNICQHLRVSTAADIKVRRYQTTLADARRVTAWLDECEFAWIESSRSASRRTRSSATSSLLRSPTKTDQYQLRPFPLLR